MSESMNAFQNLQILKARSSEKLVESLKEIKGPAEIVYFGADNANRTRWVAVLKMLGQPRPKKQAKVEQAKPTETSEG